MEHPLRRAFAANGLSAYAVAVRLQVDPKTVERWCAGRVPFQRNRFALSNLTGWSQHDLWPDEIPIAQRQIGAGELRAAYSSRSVVRPCVWQDFFAKARRQITMLIDDEPFPITDRSIAQVVLEKHFSGVEVKTLIALPRGDTDKHGDGVAAQPASSGKLASLFTEAPEIISRLGSAPGYGSIYQSDNELLACPHIYGVQLSQSPVLHFRRLEEDGIASSYFRSLALIRHRHARPS